MIYTTIPTVLKETAPTEEYELSPRNTKRVLVGHCLRSNMQHRHLPHTHSESEMSFGVKGAQNSRNKLVSNVLPLGSPNYPGTSSFDLVLVALGGIGSGKYCCVFEVLWAQALCWFSRAILALTQSFHRVSPTHRALHKPFLRLRIILK